MSPTPWTVQTVYVKHVIQGELLGPWIASAGFDGGAGDGVDTVSD